MICPYCGGDSNIKNLNIDHKYKHESSGCNKSFKRCFTCGTIYAESNEAGLANVSEVDDIFDIDFCEVCNEWLPDFPTSWIRSFTNLSKIYEFMKDIYKNKDSVINSHTLMVIQRRHNGVLYNIERAKERGADEYTTGAPVRRMNEYFGILKNMGMVIFKESDNSTSKFDLTALGEQLVQANDSKILLSCFILGFINMKLNNGFQKTMKSSCYDRFNIRFTENILKSIDCLNGKASKHQIALSVLARNNNVFETTCVKKLKEFSSKSIEDMYFKNSKEVDRGIKSTFINIFCELGILHKNGSLYYTTSLGDSLLKFMEERPAIWFDDVRNLALIDKIRVDYIFSCIIIWRLYRNNVIEESNIPSKIIKDAEKYIKKIINIDSTSIRDIQLNALYDVPLIDSTLLNNIKSNIKILLNDVYAYDEIEAFLDVLGGIWLDDIIRIIGNNDDAVNNFESKFNSDFKMNVQSGRRWHETVREQFSKLKLDISDYKDYQVFSDIKIEQLKIFLPGGTLHNPDMIIKNVNFGTQRCILVDAKDENSISEEVSKLYGYNIYSSNPNVDSYTIIALRGTLPKKAARRIEQEKDAFSRIAIIEEEAIYKLVGLKLSVDEVLKIIIPNTGFKLISKDIIIN